MAQMPVLNVEVVPGCACEHCVEHLGRFLEADDTERVRILVDNMTPKRRAMTYVQLYALGLRIDTAQREASAK